MKEIIFSIIVLSAIPFIIQLMYGAKKIKLDEYSKLLAMFGIIAALILSIHLNKLNGSSTTETLGQLGDLLGGLMNPLLSFFSLIVLLRTIRLQTSEMEETRKGTRLQIFNEYFFGAIELISKNQIINIQREQRKNIVEKIICSGSPYLTMVLTLSENSEDGIYSAKEISRTMASILVEIETSNLSENDKEKYLSILNTQKNSMIDLFILFEYFIFRDKERNTNQSKKNHLEKVKNTLAKHDFLFGIECDALAIKMQDTSDKKVNIEILEAITSYQELKQKAD